MSKANQSTGVTTSTGRHVADEAERQNKAFFAYRDEQRRLQQEAAEREALKVAEEGTKRAATQAATRAAFEGR